MGEASVRLLETAEDIERSRGLWDAMDIREPGADIDWILAWSRLSPEVLRPHALVVEQDGAPIGLAAGWIEERRVALRLGGHTFAEPAGRKLHVPHGAVAGSAAGRHAGLVMDTWWRLLGRGEADVVAHRLPAGSPLCAEARRHDAFWQGGPVDEPSTRWRVRLRGDFDALLREHSADSRRKLRRAERLRRARFGDDLVVRCLRRPRDLDRIMRDLADVGARSWKQADGHAFTSDARTRGMIEMRLARGWYRAWVLYIGGRPMAWCDGDLYRGTFFAAEYNGTTGYDAAPEYRDAGLGTAVMLRMFEDLCADPGAHAIDLGTGDWDYKRRWSNESDVESGFTLYAPRPRAMAMGLARTARAHAAGLVRLVDGASARGGKAADGRGKAAGDRKAQGGRGKAAGERKAQGGRDKAADGRGAAAVPRRPLLARFARRARSPEPD